MEGQCEKESDGSGGLTWAVGCGRAVNVDVLVWQQ